MEVKKLPLLVQLREQDVLFRLYGSMGCRQVSLTCSHESEQLHGRSCEGVTSYMRAAKKFGSKHDAQQKSEFHPCVFEAVELPSQAFDRHTFAI